jgi:hypothetical protein
LYSIQTVKVQTNTWYLIPHSVTTWCIAYNGQLYLATSGAAVRQWPRNVARDPHMRLKVGDKLYDRTLSVVTDPAETEAVLQVRAKKYSQKYPPVGQTFTVYCQASRFTGFLVATLAIGEVLIPATLTKLGKSWQASSLGEKK